jgi:hypothetical protein
MGLASQSALTVVIIWAQPSPPLTYFEDVREDLMVDGILEYWVDLD